MRAMSERVLVDVADHIATVTFNRADKHNALDGAQFEAILEAAGGGRSDRRGPRRRHARRGQELLLRHRPDRPGQRAGCRRRQPPQRPSRARGPLEHPPARLHRLDRPAGAGDRRHPRQLPRRRHADRPRGRHPLRRARRQAERPRVQWGLVPDMGITSTLPRLLPIDVAKELVYTGRILSGTERGSSGWSRTLPMTRWRPPTSWHARSPAARPTPSAPRRSSSTRHGSRMPEKDLLLETELQVALIGTPNQMEAVMSGLKKEDPDFTDPPRGRRKGPQHRLRLRLREVPRPPKTRHPR